MQTVQRNNKVELPRFNCQGSVRSLRLGSIGFLRWLITLPTSASYRAIHPADKSGVFLRRKITDLRDNSVFPLIGSQERLDWGEGTATPGKGTIAPGEGTAAPGEGTIAPGKGTASSGKGTASRGKGTASSGKGTIARGEGTIVWGEGTASPGKGTIARGEGTAGGFPAEVTG